jgi:hypothetical protein
MIETAIVLLALSPFVVGIVLLGKQLDVKHKSYDALRYSVWERTIWSAAGRNAKSEDDIKLEARDRALGNSSGGILSVAALREQGISANALWSDHRRRRLLDDESVDPLTITNAEQAAPVDVGYAWVPGIAYGSGLIDDIAELLRVDDLDLNRRAFAAVTVAVGLKPLLSSRTDERPLVQRAAGAVLSDTWSARDEAGLRNRVDRVTTNEVVEALELPARAIALQAISKGEPLYGEGQYGWDPDLRPRSDALPSAYISTRPGR